MSADWAETSLGEIASFSQGIQVPAEEQLSKFCEGLIRFVRIVDYTNDLEPIRYIEKPAERYIAGKDDIVMIRYGSQTAGKVVRGHIGAIANNMFKINLSVDFIDNGFLYYMLKDSSVYNYLRSTQSSSTMPAISFGMLKPLKVKYPNLKDQKKIAYFADCINKKIQLNQQINQTLEQMAQAIFKSWFVDLEPVKAKIATLEVGGSENDALLAAMQVISGKNPKQLTQLQTENPEHYATLRTTAELFPAAMQESELGEIPEGWDNGTLASFAVLNKNSWSVKTIPSVISYVDLANTKNGVIEATTRYLSDDAPSRARRNLMDGDTIIGTVRPGNRSFAFIKSPLDALTGSTGFAVLSPKQPSFSEYIYIAATSDDSINHLAHLADGGAYPAVRSEDVINLGVIVPPDYVVESFHHILSVNYELMANLKTENVELAELRDTLLPKLLSGELNVNQDAD